MAKKFYGLTGTKLNVAIALVAGIDFALFGYDQGVMGMSFSALEGRRLFVSKQLLTDGCRWSIDPSIVPQALPRNQCPTPAKGMDSEPLIQRAGYHRRRLYPRLLFRCLRNHLAR